ncbi:MULTISPECIES: hypothetical protein [unclassified Streptomyces]|uniref:hypothetical protein n=1 Tax=unclassified Streptomyces TaxID=2593676 RepID=UPI002259C675|nr:MULTISPECIES: hypothetical protein [unclassified Streptomyces]MCX5133111.1 hypothetical protein [Streptomyces sp. NBC_00340]MCX5283400.1 hypothetical protein [Streptomyces sp. NBC_00198]
MRALPVRRIATSALCATLLIGIAAPASMAADSDLPRGHSHAAAPVPGADALLAQTKTLGDISGVLAPVTALVDAALKADNGQIPADQATKLGQAAKDAIAKVTAAAPVAPPAAAPAVPAVPPVALPAVPPLSKNAERPRALAAADVKADALTALQTAVDSLVKAVTSGDAASVVPAATAVVTGLVNFVVATVLGGGLPAPNLPGLPALPALPTSALPTGSLPVS